MLTLRFAASLLAGAGDKTRASCIDYESGQWHGSPDLGVFSVHSGIHKKLELGTE